MLKKILCSVFGTLLSLASLTFLAAFLVYLGTRGGAAFNPEPLNAAGIVAYWAAILGTGVGGFLLLRAVRRTFRGEAEEEDYKGDYDDEDAP